MDATAIGSKGELHIWRASLERSEDEMRILESWLSGEELARADRFHFARDRRSFVAARGLLRKTLSAYTNTGPADAVFQYNSYGKPSVLQSGGPPPGITFNVSHSSWLVLFAVGSACSIGIDVERVRTDVDYGAIAESAFSDYERAALNAVDAPLQRRAFFDCWVRKEAYVKGVGQGLSLDFDRFDVTLTPGEPARLLVDRADARAAEEWHLGKLDLGETYAAAIAVKRRNVMLLWPSCEALDHLT